MASYTYSANQYTVTNELGGLLTVTQNNIPGGDSAAIYINGKEVYTTMGLISAAPTTKYYHLDQGDTVWTTGADSATFTPYIVDPSSQMGQMLATINYNNLRISDLQNQINNLEASVTNKTIAGVTPIDITNETYTVNNELGARVTGQGAKVLGLLGISVASTGIVTFNPLPSGVKNYDNTALLSGDAEVFSYNIPDGTTITSSGMSYVTVYNYIQG